MSYFLIPKINLLDTIEDDLILSEDNNYNILCNKTLYNYLNKLKEKINNIQILWDKYKKYTNTYEYIHSNIPNSNYSICRYNPLSRSFYKMIEIGNILNIFEDLPLDKCRTFHLAEGPGGFIEALVRERNNINDEYYAISLLSNNDNSVPGWYKSQSFLEKNKNVYIEKGITQDGDLLNAKNLLHCYNLYKNSCDLITGDGGFDFTIDFNKQEFLSLKLLYAQMAYAIACQKKGGTFILKFFDSFTNASLDIIFLLSSVYEEIYFYKPQTSRSANSEKYLICKNFLLADTEKLVYKMYSVISAFSEINIPYRFLNISLPYKFICGIQEINAILGQSQLEAITSTLYLINNKNNDRIEYLKKNNITKSINWCHKYKLPYNKINLNNNIFLDSNNLEK